MSLGWAVPSMCDGLHKPSIVASCSKVILILWCSLRGESRWRVLSAIFSRSLRDGRISSISATASCRRRRSLMLNASSNSFERGMANEQRLSLAQGSTYSGRHLLAGRHALSAATICLSCRIPAGFPTSEDFCGHGNQTYARDSAARYACDLGNGGYTCTQGQIFSRRLASRQICSGDRLKRTPWLFRQGAEGFRRRTRPAWSGILPEP